MVQFHEIKRTGKIPKEANAQIVKFAEIIACDDMAAAIDEIELRNKYADLVVVDSSGFTAADIKFQFGVFCQGYLTKGSSIPKLKRPLTVMIRESVRNDNVSFRKEIKDEVRHS